MVDAVEADFVGAVAEGLGEMAQSMLFAALPQALEGAIGERAAAALLLRVFSRAAYEGFKRFMERMGKGLRLSVVDVLRVFVESFPAPHPFRVFASMEVDGDVIRLFCGRCTCRGCSLVSMATIVGTIEGVLRAVGVEAKAVLTRAGRHALCRSRGEGIIVVYPEDAEDGCRVVVERLRCGPPG